MVTINIRVTCQLLVDNLVWAKGSYEPTLIKTWSRINVT